MMRAPAARGFTLVEVIIALALTALILVTLTAALFGLSQSFATATTRAERENTIIQVSRALRQQLEQTLVIDIRRDVHPHPSLTGGPQELEWFAYMPESSPVAGLHIWRLEMIPTQGGLNRLSLTLTPWAEQRIPLPSYPPHTLIDGVTQFAIAYQEAKSGAWTDHWDASELPLRLRLELTTDSLGQWPPIIVRLEP